jgi:transcriptional regulator with GAF, ATPase, and Fis domain
MKRYIPSTREAELLALLDAALNVIEELSRERPRHVYDVPDTPEMSALEIQERDLLVEALESTNWRQKEAASKLGISPRVLNYKMSQWGLRPKDRVKRTA